MSVWLSFSASESSVSVANNTSVVTVNIYANWNRQHWSYDCQPWSLNIDGTGYSGCHSFNTGQSSSGSVWIGAASKTVTHNDDGSKYVGYSASYTTGTSQGTVSNSGGITLTTIPRVSDLAVSSESVTIGGSQTVTTTKKSSSFTDVITVTCGDADPITATSGTAFSIPVSWLQQFTTSASTTATATVETFNGSTSIGTKSVQFTVNANDYSSSLTVSHQPITDTATKPSAFNGVFVQGISKPRVQTSASGYQGSTISSYVTTIEGTEYSGADISATEAVRGSGTVSCNTTITDSRGVSKTLSDNITVIAYAPPTVKATVSVSGTTATLNIKGEISPVTSGGSALNTKTCTIKFESPTTSQTDTHTLSGFTFDDDVTYTVDPTVTYTFTVTVSDLVYTGVSAKVSVTKTGIVCISRYAGGGGVTLGEEASGNGFVLAEGWNEEIKQGNLKLTNGDIHIEDATLQASLVAVFGNSIIA